MVRCPPSDCFPGRAFQIARYYCRPTRLVVGLTATSVLPHRREACKTGAKLVFTGLGPMAER